MTATTKSSSIRRIWHTPTSKAALNWALFAFCYCALFYLLYAWLRGPQRIFAGPWFDNIFRCGVMSYLMILAVAAYSLRTRFVHNLPWKTQNWVWMHIWLGIAAVLLALLHADFRFVLHNYCTQFSCLTSHYLGIPSLYLLIFIVISGIVGRFLDMWQTRTIAQEASTNKVGIAKALPSALLELEYKIERYNAGKSDSFKQFCAQALTTSGTLSSVVPSISSTEQPDFRVVYTYLEQHARLAASLQKQTRARKILRLWRTIHMILVPLTLLILTYHAIAELLINVLHIIHV